MSSTKSDHARVPHILEIEAVQLMTEAKDRIDRAAFKLGTGDDRGAALQLRLAVNRLNDAELKAFQLAFGIQDK